jgi:repressor LexA
MPEPLTPLEQRVYHYMIDFLAEHTYQPSIREIAKKFRIKSTKTVSDLLHALSSKGYIERDQSRSRGVRILGLPAAGKLTQPVPVYGGVAPTETPFGDQQRAGYVTMDRRFLPTEDVVFVLAADDARDLGVLTGDHVLLQPRAQPKDGDLVAIRDGESVRIRSHGANHGQIVGVVAGIFRPLAEQAPAPMLPISEAQAAVPVS